MPVFRKDLFCKASELLYDFDARKGTLKLAPNHNCDMRGCIDLFKGIDPGVRLIETFSGSEQDTMYKRGSRGWEAFMPARR